MRPGPGRGSLGAPLAAQIVALLLGGLVVAQATTLFLTLLLPPPPAPKYRLDDIAHRLGGADVRRPDMRPLLRTIQARPPSLSSPGWLVSEPSRAELAKLLSVDEADVRLLFYSPPPFAGAAEAPRGAFLTTQPSARSQGAPSRILLIAAGLDARIALAMAGPPSGGFRGGGPPGGGVPGGPFAGGGVGGGPALPGGGPIDPGADSAGPPAGAGAPFGRGYNPPSQGSGDPSGAPADGGAPVSGQPAGAPSPRPRGRPGPDALDALRAAVFLDEDAPPAGAAPSAGPRDPTPQRTWQEPPAGRNAAAPPRPVPPQAGPLRTAPTVPAPAPAAARTAATTALPPAPAAPKAEWTLPPSPSRGLFGLAPASVVEGDFVAALRIGTDRWVVVRPAPEPFPNHWQRRVLLWFLVSFSVVAPIGWLFARRLSAPLTAFAAAAEQLGRDPSGPVLELFGPAEIGRAARAFTVMQRRLKRYIEDRTAMVGAISHDLRTPLTRMRFRLERASPQLRESMLNDIAQMEEMISSVLIFIRDASEPTVRERVDLRSIVECVVDDAALVGGDACLEPGPPASVEVDALGVQRVVTNLVENALKYGRRAKVRLFSEAGDAVTEVADEGPGLPEEELERVFLPFYRAAPARDLNAGGIGLGLALSRSIARAHGGDVRLYRGLTGLVAQFRLPLCEPS